VAPPHLSILALAGAALNLIRVFPGRTSLTPTDPLAFVGNPRMDRPLADEVHVICIFRWDIPEAHRLAPEWCRFYPWVKVGGPALGTPGAFLARPLPHGGGDAHHPGMHRRYPWSPDPAVRWPPGQGDHENPGCRIVGGVPFCCPGTQAED